MMTNFHRGRSVLAMLLALLVACGHAAIAQAPKETAALAFTYRFQDPGGTNASAVCYVPAANVYITCIAGNPDFPIEVFDRSGKTIASMPAQLDLRGIWYNPATKCLEANAAGEEGWYSRPLDASGVPTDEWSMIREGQAQPDFQSVLAYVTPKKKLVTFHNGFFSYWGRKNGKEKVKVQYGTPIDANWYINPYCAAYTENDDFPIAVLDLNHDQILYFSLKGKYLGMTTVPTALPEMDGFRFAFANRHAFIYDEVARTWSAYRVF